MSLSGHKREKCQKLRLIRFTSLVSPAKAEAETAETAEAASAAEHPLPAEFAEAELKHVMSMSTYLFAALSLCHLQIVGPSTDARDAYMAGSALRVMHWQLASQSQWSEQSVAVAH